MPNHAVAICRFASEILSRMHVLTKELEVTLGPDTGDLALRIGIHSGPVTGGVLRGKLVCNSCNVFYLLPIEILTNFLSITM